MNRKQKEAANAEQWGCTIPILIFIFIIAVVETGNPLGSTIFALIVSGGVAAVVWSTFHSKQKQEKDTFLKQISKELETIPKWEDAVLRSYPDTRNFLQISGAHSAVRVGHLLLSGKLQYREIKSEDISSIALQENGKTVAGKLADGAILAGAGGVLFGPAGAVLGALSSTKLRNLRSLNIVLVMNSIKEPFVSIAVYNGDLPRHDAKAQLLIEDAHKIVASLDALKRITEKRS